jgi:hypothetical protein
LNSRCVCPGNQQPRETLEENSQASPDFLGLN